MGHRPWLVQRLRRNFLKRCFMIKSTHVSFFVILQMVVGFGLAPLVFLKHAFGDVAVAIYCGSAVLIISAMGFWLWAKSLCSSRVSPPNGELPALGFGLVFGFIMAEVVTVALLVKV